jgi:hypothetical protein
MPLSDFNRLAVHLRPPSNPLDACVRPTLSHGVKLPCSAAERL